ncbi:hypothetical protein [Corallococcus macrosporus]|uniref:Lipoprotein n=1 Tax=Myxococcus fulvus (strain ATCC BAA-855 / HW-1) TaxID=483219 RepID=F8C6U6_MYXFH|nr:hypothetical protein [Corallococcus macrosporus]AEI66888.1 hypothetical protein LILAB_24975 [Corallococcus macrosporus]
MSSRRPSLSWSVAVLLAFTAATASAEPSESTLTLASAAVCSQGTPSSSDVRAADEASGLVCISVRCSSDQDCWDACPTARTAACSRNACSYTHGGGGGGGGGPVCPSTRCIDDADCVCQGTQGYCFNRACSY